MIYKGKDVKNWKTRTPKEDVLKFEQIRRQGKLRYISEDTINLQISQVKKVNKKYPLVRFYGFNKSAKDLYLKNYGLEEDWKKCPGLPDGYLLKEPNEIIIIEIENYSRVNKDRLYGYIGWWDDMFDCDMQTTFAILEFNRFGNYQRDLFFSNVTRNATNGEAILRELHK